MINLENVAFSYPKSASQLLRGLNLHVKEGTISGLFGPNGSGKSTLLKILAGLLFPQSGECQIMGFTPWRRSPGFLADIYFLPEDIYVPDASPKSYVNRYAPFYPKFDVATMDKLTGEFALPSSGLLTKLSLGQKKKFLLCFAIATNARLLLLDEPSNGLDIPSKSQFRRVLLDHFSEHRTYIISTHQAHDLEGLIDSILFLTGGNMLMNQSLDRLSGKIRCSKEYSEPKSALYYESSLEGFSVIDSNTNGEETHIDLELLFNFVNSSPEKLSNLLGESR